MKLSVPVRPCMGWWLSLTTPVESPSSYSKSAPSAPSSVLLLMKLAESFMFQRELSFLRRTLSTRPSLSILPIISSPGASMGLVTSRETCVMKV